MAAETPVNLQDILQAFEAWEAVAAEYKRLLQTTASLGADMNWTVMSELIDRMSDAREHWLDMSQRYCDEMAQLKFSGSTK
ncbi:MAG: hypothetical protein AB7O64_10610 [Methylibium sp.]|uniref:hypothetical protein n=1 Tax=Methylibium sp. T29-B TaxID=1437443 RepID=UPI0003F476B3|nr:hypothetical protein [Methylibium sp. T29-B]EWS54815.1 hypothetical protein X551_02371 [Methylibium sp. T29]EWS61501.1 hypothetical protein Y694_00775 [Methylibium sp. T29-B]